MELFADAELSGEYEKKETALNLFSITLKGLSAQRIINIQIGLMYEADIRPRIFAEALDILEGQLILRQIAGNKSWR